MKTSTETLLVLVVAAIVGIWLLTDVGRSEPPPCTHGESSAVYDTRTGKTEILDDTGCTRGGG